MSEKLDILIFDKMGLTSYKVSPTVTFDFYGLISDNFTLSITGTSSLILCKTPFDTV